jgi:hypothetical protein
MEKDLIYNFNLIFSCGTEYNFQMKGQDKISNILNKIAEDLEIEIPDNLPIVLSKIDILKFKNEKIQDLQFFVRDEVTELYINLPLKGNISSYLDNIEMEYDFKDDDDIPLTVKVEKKHKNVKNIPVNPKNASVAISNTHTHVNVNDQINSKANSNIADLNSTLANLGLQSDAETIEDLVEEIYFHPEKITNLSTKTPNITSKMLTEAKITLPVQVCLEVGEFPMNPKASLDLICVIDKSGSMHGDPIESVRNSLDAILDLLGEKDRVCLIIFDSVAKRITNLMQMSSNNKSDFKQKVHSEALDPYNGTNIGNGLQQALETLVQRKIINNVSSIFLLSDGQDNVFEESNCEKLLEKIEKIIKSDKLKDFNYSINTFGYSESHDSDLLSKLALLKKGNFYFINDMSSTPVIFRDCIDFMQKVFCKELTITLKPTANAKIVKVLGEENWKIDKNGFYYTKLDQLTYKRKLNFVFEVEILNLNKKQTLEMLKKNGLTLVKVEGKLIGLNEYGNPATEIQAESVTFLEKDSVTIEIDPEIIVNMERFNLCQIIKKSS